MPRLTGHLQPRRNWPILASNVLITHPVGLPPVPWTEKQLKGHHYSYDAEVIAAAETWFVRQPSEFF